MRLVLASASPRRTLLLTVAGYPHDVRVPDVEESLIEGEPAAEAVLRLSDAKARSVPRRSHEVVLAADTMVVLNGELLGKPLNAADAHEMLSRLSGRTHSVLTGWTISGDEGERFGVAESRVTFKKLTSETISEYLVDAEPLDKAGSYALQGERGRLVAGVSGSRANVMGLPLGDVARTLAEFGIERSPADR